MSKKFVLIALTAIAAITTNAWSAGDPLKGVAGYDSAGGSSITLTASAVKDKSYTITIAGMIGVTPDALNGLTPYAKVMDVPLKKEVGLYKLPEDR